MFISRFSLLVLLSPLIIASLSACLHDSRLCRHHTTLLLLLLRFSVSVAFELFSRVDKYRDNVHPFEILKQ